MNKVKLSTETIEIMKNYSMINPGMILHKGNTLRTISVSGAIFSECVISETIPMDFGIGMLSQFIQVLTLPNMADCEVEFTDTHADIVAPSGDRIRYYKQEANAIVTTDKINSLPTPSFSFKLTSDQLIDFLKTAAVLKSRAMVISVENNKLTMNATIPKKDSTHSYKLCLPDVSCPDMAIVMDISKGFNVLHDDYTINVMNDIGMELCSDNRKLRYAMATIDD